LFFKVDIYLMILGLIFPIGGFLGVINLQTALMIFILHTVILLFSSLAKAKKLRIYCGIAYGFFLTSFTFLMVYGKGNFPLYEYFLIGFGAAIVPLIFRFRTYAITGGVIGYWLALLFNILGNRDTFSNINEIFQFITSNFLNGMTSNNESYFSLLLIGFCVVGIFSFMGTNKTFDKVVRRFGKIIGGGAPSSLSNSNYDGAYEDYNEDYSGSGRSSRSHSRSNSEDTNDTNHYGWSQSSIDLDNEKKHYGTPSWYEKKEREKSDYGKPWYARDDD